MLFRRILSITTLVVILLCSAHAYALPPENQQLTRIAAAIQNILRGMDADVQQAAQSLTSTPFDSAPARNILSELCRKHRHAVDCAIIDGRGTIIAIEPGTFHKNVGRNVGNQPQVDKLRRTVRPVLSRIFKAIEGNYVFALQWPIKSKGGKLAGSVSMIVKPEPFLKKVIIPELKARDAFNVWVMQSNGRVLYSRHTEEIGSYASGNDSYIGNRSLVAILREAQHKASGSKEYHQEGIGRAESKDMALYWTTIKLHGTAWRVILFGNPAY